MTDLLGPTPVLDTVLAAATVVIDVPAGSRPHQIQALVDTAPPGAALRLEPGLYYFNEPVVVERDDIAILGSGVGQTTITLAPDIADAPAFRIGGSVFLHDLAPPVTIMAGGHVGDTVLTLAGGHGLAPGDPLFLERPNDADFFAAIGDANWQQGTPLRSAILRVASVDGSTVTLADPLPFDFDSTETVAAKITLYSGVAMGGFTLRTALGPADPGVFANTQPAAHRATMIEAANTDGLILADIRVEDAFSNGIALAAALEPQVRDVTVAGAHNKGGGGNGYALHVRDVFGGAFSDLQLFDTRHALVFSSHNSAIGNRFHIAATNRDVNFHGGRDADNVVIVDRSVREGAEIGYMAPVVWINPGTSYGAPTEAEANLVVLREVAGTVRSDWAIAHPTGAVIATEGGDDLLIGGTGDDVLIGGTGHDTFVLSPGRDEIDGGDGDDRVRIDLPLADIQAVRVDGPTEIRTAFGVSLLRYVETVEVEGRILGLSRLRSETADHVVPAPDPSPAVVLPAPAPALRPGTVVPGGPGWERADLVTDATLGSDLEAAELLGTSDLHLTGNSLDNHVLGNAGANWLLGGDGRDRLLGREGDDRLEGGDGDDALFGNPGRDVLHGGSGDDRLDGGSGADLFVAAPGFDVVLDYDPTEDTLLIPDIPFAEIAAALNAAAGFPGVALGVQARAATDPVTGQPGTEIVSDTGDGLFLLGWSPADLADWQIG